MTARCFTPQTWDTETHSTWQTWTLTARDWNTIWCWNQSLTVPITAMHGRARYCFARKTSVIQAVDWLPT